MDVDASPSVLRYYTHLNLWRMVDLLRNLLKDQLLSIIGYVDPDQTAVRTNTDVYIRMIETIQHRSHHPDRTIHLIHAPDESDCLPFRPNIHSDHDSDDMSIEKP